MKAIHKKIFLILLFIQIPYAFPLCGFFENELTKEKLQKLNREIKNEIKKVAEEHGMYTEEVEELLENLNPRHSKKRKNHNNLSWLPKSEIFKTLALASVLTWLAIYVREHRNADEDTQTLKFRERVNKHEKTIRELKQDKERIEEVNKLLVQKMRTDIINNKAYKIPKGVLHHISFIFSEAIGLMQDKEENDFLQKIGLKKKNPKNKEFFTADGHKYRTSGWASEGE